MPDLMTIDVPDIPTARAEQVWAHVLETAARQQSRTKKRRAVGISAGATTLAGVVGFALAAPTSSFASWTDVPTPIVVSLSDPSLAPCLSALTDEGPTRVGPSALKPILGERRGDFTSLLVTGGGVISMCISGGDFRIGGSTQAAQLRGGTTISLSGTGGIVDAEGPRYVYGQVAGDVRGVTVLTKDGVRVTASVRDGYFVAWWPTSGAPATVTATDESGGILAALTPSGG